MFFKIKFGYVGTNFDNMLNEQIDIIVLCKHYEHLIMVFEKRPWNSLMVKIRQISIGA